MTGGSRGIGLAVAKALAAEGADVALLARDKAALETARETVATASGRQVLAVGADTGDDESVRAAVRAVAEGPAASTSWSTPRPGRTPAR